MALRPAFVCAVALAFAGAGAALAGASAPTGARTPLATPRTAAWLCQSGRCNYRKAQGGWSDCFTSWSPTHGGWLPTRYCR